MAPDTTYRYDDYFGHVVEERFEVHEQDSRGRHSGRTRTVREATRAQLMKSGVWYVSAGGVGSPAWMYFKAVKAQARKARS